MGLLLWGHSYLEIEKKNKIRDFMQRALLVFIPNINSNQISFYWTSHCCLPSYSSPGNMNCLRICLFVCLFVWMTLTLLPGMDIQLRPGTTLMPHNQFIDGQMINSNLPKELCCRVLTAFDKLVEQSRRCSGWLFEEECY